jgi:RNA methyltransferase, TrmH family
MQMLTKATIKFIKSLQEKKYRKQEQCFIVEGAKTVEETLQSDYEVRLLVAAEHFIEKAAVEQRVHCIVATPAELQSLGSFQTNDAALAVVKMKQEQTTIRFVEDQFSLLLDDIRDPGNLGTIIRAADWYGVTTIVASPETVDFYSPKVISATKGSFIRVNFQYALLPAVLNTNALPVFGAFLRGEDVHKTNFGKGGLLVIGNESNGISPAVEKFVTRRITIPNYGKAESLNAAMATAIILDNTKR